ncbi:MAG: 50S ribosomal protein L11 methyltransferase [Anaerolineae bacterium]|nr:50S ribosomal protein L11 methyltransferase [Anaerolineae bacterium]
MDSEARWLEVSMTVDGELAEAVAEVLGRFANNGVVVESAVTYNDAEDEGTPIGPVRIYGYLLADEQLEETRRNLSEALWHLGQIQPLPEPEYRSIVDEDWMASWKKHYHPIPIGERLLILPAWIEEEQPGRAAVRIDPSMAFGTGTHPTTQLCLEIIEAYTQPGETAIDVGCGSGILSIAALKLGARRVLGVDIDRAAVKATRQNAEANELASRIEVGVGSVDEIRKGMFSLRQAPFVLANILAPVIIRLFDAGLAELVERGGILALSGILAEQSPAVEAAALKQGLTFVERRQSGDWVALVFQKHG